MAARFAWSGLVLVDNVSGKPITNGKINFWVNGTTNDQDTFPTVALSGANVNPLILDANGRVPEAWSNDTDVYAIRVLDENDNVILATVQDISFISPFTLSSADVLAGLAANTEAVDIAGSSMVGSAFSSFADALTLTAAGSIDASAGAITLGTVTGTTTFSGIISVDDTTDSTSATTGSIHTDGGLGVAKDAFFGADIDLIAAAPTINLGSAAVSTGNVTLNMGTGRTGDGFSILNLVGDTSFPTFGFRVIRAGTANGVTQLRHRGTGTLSLNTDDAAPMVFTTDAVTRLTLSAAGLATFTGVVSVDDTTDSTSGTTGSIHTDGGIGVAKDVFVVGSVTVSTLAGTGSRTVVADANGVLSAP